MHVQMAKWIPGSSGLVYVRDNNVFLRRQPNGGSREIQLTLDGEPGVKYNGVSDWVYEGKIMEIVPVVYYVPLKTELNVSATLKTKILIKLKSQFI